MKTILFIFGTFVLSCFAHATDPVAPAEAQLYFRDFEVDVPFEASTGYFSKGAIVTPAPCNLAARPIDCASFTATKYAIENLRLHQLSTQTAELNMTGGKVNEAFDIMVFLSGKDSGGATVKKAFSVHVTLNHAKAKRLEPAIEAVSAFLLEN